MEIMSEQPGARTRGVVAWALVVRLLEDDSAEASEFKWLVSFALVSSTCRVREAKQKVLEIGKVTNLMGGRAPTRSVCLRCSAASLYLRPNPSPSSTCSHPIRLPPAST